MLSIEAMKKLRDAYSHHLAPTEAEVLSKLGNPSQAEIVESAWAGLQSDDRNVRVVMLRVLKEQSGEQAMRGILSGLTDEKRRVRSVALKCCGNFLHHPEIIERLQMMVTDDDEKPKIRQSALSILAGSVGQGEQVFPQATLEALDLLIAQQTYRAGILWALVQLNLSEQVEALLKAFVESGTKEEAVLATKALCGYQAVHINRFPDEDHQEIRQTYELARARMHYWIKRDDLARFHLGELL